MTLTGGPKFKFDIKRFQAHDFLWDCLTSQAPSTIDKRHINMLSLANLFTLERWAPKAYLTTSKKILSN